VKLKRDRLPREVLSQAIDYASDIVSWTTIDRINEVCEKNTDKSIEAFTTDTFEDVSIENLSVNEAQRILLVGFRIEESLERMISWLEEVEKERAKKKRFTIPMSDEPGDFEEEELEELLRGYFSQNIKSARRIKNVLITECLKQKVVTREELKKAFIDHNEPNTEKNAGYFMSLISQQIGMEKNSFLRQFISYEYTNNSWEKDNYRIRDEYRNLLQKLLETEETAITSGWSRRLLIASLLRRRNSSRAFAFITNKSYHIAIICCIMLFFMLSLS